MAGEFDFNPDFSDDTSEEPVQNNKITVIPAATVVRNDSNQSVTISKLLDMTKQHIQDDERVRSEIDEIAGIIDSTMSQMTIKEMIEYLKVKLKEREMHIKFIFDSYKFIQQTEMAREMLIGSDRRERVAQAVDNNKMTKILGFLNSNFTR